MTDTAPAPAPAIPSNGWTAQSLTLIVEERICNCGEAHIVPGDIFVRLTQGWPKKEWLVKRTRIEFDGYLPQETRQVTSYVDACQCCWMEGSALDQLSFFPQPEPIQLQPPSVRIANNEKLRLVEKSQPKKSTPNENIPVVNLEDFF